jgi:molecular chaperone GrpE
MPKKDKKKNKELEKLQEDLEENNQKIGELTNMAQRAIADLQNYKKRMEEDKKEFINYAKAEAIGTFLPIYDNLLRALAHTPDDLKENEWIKGIESIKMQFEGILNQFQVTQIKCVGEKFDPNLHEALLTDKGEKDIVLEELEPGYMLGDRVLKAAKVKVGA